MGKKEKESETREVEIVKIGKNVFIKWKEGSGADVKSTSKTFPYAPKESFKAAVKALAPMVYHVHEETESRAKKLTSTTTITEVIIKRKESELVGEVKGYRELMKGNRRMPIHMKPIVEGEEDGLGVLLEAVCEQATMYIDGNRVAIEATGDLFGKKDK